MIKLRMFVLRMECSLYLGQGDMFNTDKDISHNHNNSVRTTDKPCLQIIIAILNDRLCGLLGRVPSKRFRSPGLIPSATKFSEKY
jgi:hypothetical protein